MTASLADPLSATELAAIRADFPVLSRRVRDGVPLVYLDTGATSQRPLVVLDTMRDFSTNHNAAVHRGAHALAEEATVAFEGARRTVAEFFGVRPGEIVFTSGTTGAINMLTMSLSNASRGSGGAMARRMSIQPGDRIVVTQAEHHSNLVPWQQLAARTDAELTWIRVDDDGRLRLDDLEDAVNARTKIVAFTHASNVTGAVTDVPVVVAAAHAVGAYTVLDAAQTAGHLPVDLRDLDVDFAAMSGHKTLGPNGIGALYGKSDLLEALPPGFTGGSMVEIVTMTEATFLPPPSRFEAGTQAVTEAIGWAAALGYLSEVGMDRVAAHEAELTERMLSGIGGIDGIRVLGPTSVYDRLGNVAVDIDGVHPHDAGQYLDSLGYAVRVGHHCAQPVHRALGTHSSTRASLGLYNTADEVDGYVEALSHVREYFGVA
jgi:cysteine desulfurase/selenocysteine lyase